MGAAELEEMKLEEFMQKSNLVRTQALEKSGKFLKDIHEKELPKPFNIAEREEEFNHEEDKMRKAKEKQIAAEKEEEHRRRELKVSLFDLELVGND